MSGSNLPEIPEDGKKAAAIIATAATTGAVVGSFVPVIGTVLGAAGGGLLASIAVIVNKIKNG